jgi:hypothetical protein
MLNFVTTDNGSDNTEPLVVTEPDRALMAYHDFNRDAAATSSRGSGSHSFDNLDPNRPP